MSQRFGRLATTALAAITISGAAALSVPLSASATTTVANVADRGASAYEPENTIAAIDEAKARNATMVKLDVQETKDGRLILMHDATLARTTNVELLFPDRGPWNVGDFTLAEIRQLDAGSWFSPANAGERVPTIEEALTAVANDHLGVIIEPHIATTDTAKVSAAVNSKQAQAAWSAVTAVSSGTWPFVVQSSDETFLRTLHRFVPWLPTGFVGTPSADHLPDLAKFVDLVDTPQADITADYVAQIHARGLKSYTFTVNNATVMGQVIGTGVDGILTARPDVLDGVLNPAPAA